MKYNKGPKILVYDIETAPILGYVWGLWDQTIGLNQIKDDWHLLSWAAKWYGEPASKIMYQDQRKSKKLEDDGKILKGLWKLLDEADIVITQNGKKFDEKKLNSRFILNGMEPPSKCKHIDTCQIARSKFGFTSNKLEYLTDRLNTKYKKLSHGKYPGFKLWEACLKRDMKAWKEMEKYNKYDILSLEELYTKLQPWDNTVNFDLYMEQETMVCNCGSTEFKRNGFSYTGSSKFTRYRCKKCGSERRSKKNLFSKGKRNSLTGKVT